MNNLKKIGLTALAASLVSTSVFAGEVTVAGSASMTVEGYSGTDQDAGKGFSMGNQLTFTGGGELDNGLTVGISFVLDQGDNETETEAGEGTSPFDSHSVSISSDALGKLTLHGEGGSSAQGALDTTAAGDVWDTFNNVALTTGVAVKSSSANGDTLVYALPTMMDDLAISASYSPQEATVSSATSYSATYTGVEGLSVSYGKGEVTTAAGPNGANADATTMKASYAYGSFTLAYSDNDYATDVANNDQETTSYKVSYTVSDEISVSYGHEEIDEESEALDAEFEKISVAYTSGGMTLTATAAESSDAAHSSGTADDRDYWSLGLAFAF
jgi:outer membrane protein OmpU